MIGIVTDSMSCLSEQDCANNNVHLVHAYCCLNGKKVKDSVCELGCHPHLSTTFAPSSADYYKTFLRLSHTCEGIICITSSCKVSMSYSNACIAARACQNDRIAVVDSGSTAGAIYLLIKLARDLEASGAGFVDIVRIITNRKQNIKVSFSMRSFNNISHSRQILSMAGEHHMPILGQRPVCTFSEAGGIALVETASDALSELKAIVAPHRNSRRFAVYYSEADMHLYELMSMLRRRFPRAEIIKRRASLTIRAVLGEGVLGVFSFGWDDNGKM